MQAAPDEGPGGNGGWVAPERGRSRWRRLLPAVALVALGALLLVTADRDGEPGTDDELTVSAEEGAASAEEGADDGEEGADDGEEGDEAADASDALPPPIDVAPVDRLPRTHADLYALTRDALVRVDLATGQRTVRELPAVGDSTTDLPSVAVVGDTVVVARPPGVALALPAAGSGEPLELARRDPAGARTPGLVGVYPAPGDAVTLLWIDHTGSQELQLVDVATADTLATDRLPERSHLVHVDGRTAVIAFAGEIFRHDFAAGTGERVAVGSPVAADDERVVYVRCTPGLSCSMRSRRFGEDSSRRVGSAPPAPMFPWPTGDSLSPDGRWLRSVTFGEEASVSVLDLETGAAQSRPDVLGAMESAQPATWTPEGAWVLEAQLSTVVAWHPQHDDVFELDLGASRINGLAVAPH